MRDYNSPKRFIMIIRFGTDEPLRTRVKESAPKIKDIIEQYCPDEYQLAFTTNDGSTFAYVIKTKTNIHTISKVLRGTLRDGPQTSILLDDDFYLFAELGKDFSGSHSKAATWFQHH